MCLFDVLFACVAVCCTMHAVSINLMKNYKKYYMRSNEELSKRNHSNLMKNFPKPNCLNVLEWFHFLYIVHI